MTAPTTSSKTIRRSNNRSVVASLRALMPTRPLSFAEACRLAELQAQRLLQLTGSTSPPVSEEIITDLPRIDVQWMDNLIGSGATTWSRGQWRVRLNAAEPPTRQRFTLAHELKHILDAANEDVIYRDLPAGPARQRFIEAVCDHFAACLLMPRAWVKRLWGEGAQDLGGLAWRFEVSQQAMLIRLQYVGLVDPLPRCTTWQRLGSVAVGGSRRGHGRHRRYSPPTRRYHRPARFALAAPLNGVPL